MEEDSIPPSHDRLRAACEEKKKKRRNAIIARNEREINANYAAFQELPQLRLFWLKLAIFRCRTPLPLPSLREWAVTLRNKLNMGVNFVDFFFFCSFRYFIMKLFLCLTDTDHAKGGPQKPIANTVEKQEGSEIYYEV